jgi:RNA polymerase sigma-70 factor (ECF subfamily)
MFHATTTANFSSATAYDADLVRRFNAGDNDAFTEIVGRHQKRVLLLVRRFLKNEHDAEDVVQDTFIRAHRALANFRGDSALSTWLVRIAMNLACNRYWYFFRRQRQNTISLNQPTRDSMNNSLNELVAANAPAPHRVTMHNEFIEIVADCMKKLEEPHREILSLRYLKQASYEEIGEALDINFGTVKSRIARARENLRALILEAAPEFGRNAAMEGFFEPDRNEATAILPTPA